MTPLLGGAAGAGSPAEFLGTALRLAVAAGLALAALAILLLGHPARRNAGGRRRKHAKTGPAFIPLARPRRPGLDEITLIVGKARSRPHARDLLQTRLRALSRDIASTRLGLGEAEARALVERGDFPPGAGDLLLRDELSGGGGQDRAFVDACDRLVASLEDWAEYHEDKED